MCVKMRQQFGLNIFLQGYQVMKKTALWCVACLIWVGLLACDGGGQDTPKAEPDKPAAGEKASSDADKAKGAGEGDGAEKAAEAKAGDAPAEGAASPTEVGILTASTGGNYYKAATELQRVWEGTDFKLSIQTSPGSFHNVRAVGEGKSMLAISQFDTIMVYFGMNDEGRRLAESCHVLAPLGEEYIHIVVNKEAGIESLADLKGKRINVGPEHSGSWVSAWTLMHYINKTNITADKNVTQSTYEQALADLADGKLDAAFLTTAPGMPLLKSLPADKAEKLSLLSLPADFEMPEALQPVYKLREVPAGTYPFQKEASTTLATGSYMIVQRDADAEKIKALAAAVYGQAEQLGKSSTLWSRLDPAQVKAEAGKIPYHAGVLAHLGIESK